MTERNHRRQRRTLQALLAVRAIEPLDAARADELERLLGDYPDVDATAYERAAAAVWLAAAPSSVEVREVSCLEH